MIDLYLKIKIFGFLICIGILILCAAIFIIKISILEKKKEKKEKKENDRVNKTI